MEINVQRNENRGTIQVSGELRTIGNCARLRGAIESLLGTGLQTIVLDLTGLCFMTASFCGFVASAYKAAKADRVRLQILVDPNSLVHDVVRTARFDTIIDVYLETTA